MLSSHSKSNDFGLKSINIVFSIQRADILEEDAFSLDISLANLDKVCILSKVLGS